jgi:hypothetical protein
MDVLRALTPRDPMDPVLYPDPAPGDRPDPRRDHRALIVRRKDY